MTGGESFELLPSQDSLRGKIVSGHHVELCSRATELLDLPADLAGFPGDLSEDVRPGALQLFFDSGGVEKVFFRRPDHDEDARASRIINGDPACEGSRSTLVNGMLVFESGDAEKDAMQQKHEEGAEPGEQLQGRPSCLA